MRSVHSTAARQQACDLHADGFDHLEHRARHGGNRRDDLGHHDVAGSLAVVLFDVEPESQETSAQALDPAESRAHDVLDRNDFLHGTRHPKPMRRWRQSAQGAHVLQVNLSVNVAYAWGVASWGANQRAKAPICQAGTSEQLFQAILPENEIPNSEQSFSRFGRRKPPCICRSASVAASATPICLSRENASPTPALHSQSIKRSSVDTSGTPLRGRHEYRARRRTGNGLPRDRAVNPVSAATYSAIGTSDRQVKRAEVQGSATVTGKVEGLRSNSAIHEGPLPQGGEGMRLPASERWGSLADKAARLFGQREETPLQPPAPLRRGTRKCVPHPFSSGGGLGIHQPGSNTRGGCMYATAPSGRARDRAKCPAAARSFRGSAA